MTEKIQKLLNALEKNNIKGFFAENEEKAREIVKDMLFNGATITAGGSVSVKQTGIFDMINSPNYNFLDRNKEGLTEKQREDCFKACIGGDFYFCSANAVTIDGVLVNTDGFSNRISSICFGPKKVIMIVGVNKIVENLDEAVLRIKTEAAPKNCVRLKRNTPCAKSGRCIALEQKKYPQIFEGCNSPDRICRNNLISTKQADKDRINVIIVNKNLGY